ncbi:MAG: type II toxin-antitoxin system VapC family toxin [Chloroflexi bacterium]|nr:type II toxin-antitoxin system VapC family toxin [Chloroflexota bacterium]
MIVLDTHSWIWWVHGDTRLTVNQTQSILKHETDVIGINPISCWEIAKLVEYGRIALPLAIEVWFEQALNYPGVQLLDFSPQIAIAATQLPGNFHRDPADQIVVATARIYQCPLVTSDKRILDYPHVDTII